jgi:hypothetical protein
VYRWDIPDYIDDRGHYRPPIELKEPREIVWHCLRLTNEMDCAWMIAPAQIVQNGRDTLPCTAPGAVSLLRVTQAREIEAEELELEIARERDAARLCYNDCDLVTVRGTLSLTSRRDKPTALEVVKMLSGDVQEVSPDAVSEQLAANLRGVNQRGRLTWELTLDPSRWRLVTVGGTLKMTSHLNGEVTVEAAKMLTGEVQETSPEAEVVKLAAGLKRVNPRSRLTWPPCPWARSWR